MNEKVFKAFNEKLVEILLQRFVSVDGSKFQACNSKDNNFTANKLNDKIKWLKQHVEEYLRQIASADEMEDGEELAGQFTREELEEKLRKAKERLEKYEWYWEYMEKNGVSQMSLVDQETALIFLGYNLVRQ